MPRRAAWRSPGMGLGIEPEGFEMKLRDALRNLARLTDDDLNHARQGADFALRGHAADRVEAGKWRRIVARFDAEMRRRRALLRGASLALLVILPGLAVAQEAPRGRETTRDAFMARAERAAAKRFDRIDTDGNGVLTAAERAADRERRRAAWHARQAAIEARRAGSAAAGP